MSATAQPGWWRRRWKWLLAGACLGVLVLAATAVFGMFALVFGAIRASTPYQHALHVARSSPAVVLALGGPVEPGLLPSGYIHVDSHGDGEARLRIPLHGSRQRATLHVQGERIDGRWHYRVLAVHIDATGRRIDLLGVSLPQDSCRTANAASCSTTRA